MSSWTLLSDHVCKTQSRRPSQHPAQSSPHASIILITGAWVGFSVQYRLVAVLPKTTQSCCLCDLLPSYYCKSYHLENNVYSSTPSYEFNTQTAFCNRRYFYSSLICFMKPKSTETFLYNVWNDIRILLSLAIISIVHKQNCPQTT